jgi:hypothetical protein
VAQGVMLGARALVAVRLDALAPWLDRLEPFLMGSYVDPFVDADEDHAFQIATGASLLFHPQLRLQVEAEVTRSPDPIRLQQASRNVLFTQLGAVF